MSNKDSISLLGCGWLGFPLAMSLVSEGFPVRASTTTMSKLEVFEKTGIDPYLVQFSSSAPPADLKKLLDTKTLIISIPPGRRDPEGFQNYQRMVESVCRELPGSKVRKLILVSSTSVYPDNNKILNENANILPDTASGKLMAETEAIFRNQNVNMISLRLAGLIGPGRMPGKFFSGKTSIPNGMAPVNLIHLEDVIGIIQHLILDENASGVYNGCAPSHPSREEFYTLAASIEGLPQPQFISEKANWKIVSSVRLKSELNYSFKTPSLMDWLYSLSSI